VHGKADRREEKDEGSRHIVKLVWEKPPVVPDEPLAPNTAELVPMTAVSTFRSWADFRKWYREGVRGFTEPDAQVQKLAADLTKGKSGREERIAALFEFVADDIRYVNYVSAERWLPNRPQQVLARREGDCDDKAILLVALLKAIGIDAEEVMVQTRLTGQPSIVRAKNVAVPLFDHGIAFLNSGQRYLDATSPQARLGPLPSMDAGGIALRIDGEGGIVELPASRPEDHGSDVTWTLQLSAEGDANLVGEEQHAGDSAFWLRTYLTEEGARQSYVEHNLVAGWFPTVEVDKQVDFKGTLQGGRAFVKYKAHSQGLVRREDGDLVVPVARTTTLTSELAPLAKRTLPVVLPPYIAPAHENRTMRLVAPAGWKWAELPPEGAEDGGPFGRAKLELRIEGKTAIVARSLALTQATIPPEQYDAWRAWLGKVDALFQRRLRLVPTGERNEKAKVTR
jgi:hypothetical protein